ncbi:MAG: hypothetical protein H0W53_19540 [Acidobacteria bacterium]|nr:hypothetical protein [Acidobacteriota bacterium]
MKGFKIQHSALLFLLLALAWSWPLATRLSWRIPHDPGDPLLNTWILWWSTQALPFTERWWNAPVFYPMTGSFALSEHLVGVALFTAPLHLLGVNPIAAYNVALILSSWLSGLFAYRLGRKLTGSPAAGVLLGAAFAFAPYRASQLSHLQVLTAQWMPLALFAMHTYLDDRRRRWLALFAGAWLIQALSNGYYLLFFPVLIVLWLAWFIDWRKDPRPGVALGLTFVASSLLLVPTLLKYREVHAALGLERTLEEMQMFSARMASFVQTGYLLKYWTPRDAMTQEGFLFPGATVPLLLLAGALVLLFRRHLREAVAKRSPALFYSSAAVMFWWLCFGPASSNTIGGVLSQPYSLLTWLPGFSGLRVPARFAMMATLCAATGAAIAAARLAPRPLWARVGLGVVLVVMLVRDSWILPMPLAAPPARVILPDVANAVVLELPADDSAVNIAAMYRAMTHGRPLVNGYSGHTPQHYSLLTTSLMRGDPSPLTYFAAGRPLVVVVHRRLDPKGEWRALVERAGGVLHEESGTGPVFLVPPRPQERKPAIGPQLPATAVKSAAGVATLDLGPEQVIRALTVNLRWRHAEIGTDSLVETSHDGSAWTKAWEGWTGGLALSAALEDQRLVAMTIPLPDVRARFVRISTVPLWVSREMSVHGPR